VALNTDDSPDALPDVVPASLVTAAQRTGDVAFAGTVVSRVSLGIPSLSALPALAGGRYDAFAGLLAGSHTMQVWYAGVDRQRVALLGAGQETDLFRNGRQLWQWSSADRVAQHTLLPAGSAPVSPGQPEALTPVALASGALAALDGETQLSLADEVSVADRTAYDLVLTPRSHRTKIGSVHVAIDGATSVPLGVQVYARAAQSPAIDVAFTSIRFGTPAQRNFEFVPPPNATVTEAGGGAGLPAVADLIGSGWTTVYRLAGVPGRRSASPVAAEFRKLPTVSGPWGKGRLVQSELLSLLVTKDGQVYVGAVRPGRLYAAAARRPAP
jgi:outer membrane lipoprotein-sorting protein